MPEITSVNILNDEHALVEKLSEEVHNASMEEKSAQGFHSPADCTSVPKQVFDKTGESPNSNKPIKDGKFHKWCNKCHPDMYPYEELPENIKDYDRVTVRTVLNAMEKLASEV